MSVGPGWPRATAVVLLALAVGPGLTGRGRVEAQAPAGSPPASSPPAAADSVAALPAGHSYLVLFSPGPNWDAMKAPPEQSGFREHGQNLGRLQTEGRIVLGARYSDKGMLVMRGKSLEAVRAELAEDPGVKAGIFSFEAHPLQPFYDGCLERTKR
jgi:hypothetical protein